MEIVHKKNTAYHLAIPMVDSSTPASFKTGLTIATSAYSRDGSGAWTTLTLTDSFAEIGSTGIYEVDLTADEMNHDQVLIKMSVAGAADSLVLFRMESHTNDDISAKLARGENVL